jgi:phosphocarrier protein HPr
MPEMTFEIHNKVGLHARPAALFVQQANKFRCQIWVKKDDTEVNAKSIMGILTLGVEQGSQITIRAEGEGAEEALKAFAELHRTNFGEKV